MSPLDIKLGRTKVRSKTVSSVGTTQNELLTGFETRVNDTDPYDFSTIVFAENCINTLKDVKFNLVSLIFG